MADYKLRRTACGSRTCNIHWKTVRIRETNIVRDPCGQFYTLQLRLRRNKHQAIEVTLPQNNWSQKPTKRIRKNHELFYLKFHLIFTISSDDSENWYTNETQVSIINRGEIHLTVRLHVSYPRMSSIFQTNSIRTHRNRTGFLRENQTRRLLSLNMQAFII